MNGAGTATISNGAEIHQKVRPRPLPIGWKVIIGDAAQSTVSALDDEIDVNAPAYQPSAHYYRRALRATDDAASLRAIGFALSSELENVKNWAADLGMTPPKRHVMRSEAEAKGWQLEVCS